MLPAARRKAEVSIIDLVWMLYQIDRYHGRTCEHCLFAQKWKHGVTCAQGYEPFGHDDNCFDWEPRENWRDRKTTDARSVA